MDGDGNNNNADDDDGHTVHRRNKMDRINKLVGSKWLKIEFPSRTIV
jgi:hypothetical protein